MKGCCLQCFALDGIASGFRVAADGEGFTCADCGQRFCSFEGRWLRHVTAAELAEIARERDAKEPRH